MSLLIITDGKISDSASIVPVNTVTDYSFGGRILGTVYTNTTGKTLFVIIAVLCEVLDIGGGFAKAQLYTIIGGVTYGVWSGISPAAGTIIGNTGCLVLPVKPGAGYRLLDYTAGVNSKVTMISWIEVY